MTGPSADQRTWRHEVGERLRYLRDAAGWTQGRLARVSGVSVATVSAYELGRSAADLGALARLAGALHVPVARLTEGNDHYAD